MRFNIPITRFIHVESLAGFTLFLSAIVAFAVANSSLGPFYTAFFNTPLHLNLGLFSLHHSLLYWINDGLMAIFFLLVTLEIKRETVSGELNSFQKSLLPVVAAFGGMLVPALIYALFNYADPIDIRGFAIPSATDTAFALGVLSLVRSRVPLSLKVFLTAVAIFDDIGAILIIAVYYTNSLSYVALGGALFFVVLLALLYVAGTRRMGFYLVLGLCLWASLLHSGVHAVLAGVITALFIPHRIHREGEPSHLVRLETMLHPYVAYGILPLFAFANAGVSLSGLHWGELLSPVSLGIILGLCIGKPIGIFTATKLAMMMKIAKLPDKADQRGLFGVSLMCGVGFTMSLFVGALAFHGQDHSYEVWVRLGVIVGSVLSACLALLFFKLLGRKQF